MLGLGWFFVAYLVRVYVNLLIEPQVNPIKHFPVVTVSHKMILPLSFHADPAMLTGDTAGAKGSALRRRRRSCSCCPGVFGFLVWELKENWRLYEANRSETLRPVIVGDHGETMAGCSGRASTRARCPSCSPSSGRPSAGPAAGTTRRR